jgi:uncharacterized membrane protein YoaK (UPF0700 family)
MPPPSPAASLTPEALARKRANTRTGLILASVALTFFVGIIVAKMLGGFDEGISIMGILVCLYLVIAIGRNVRSRS